MEFGIFNLMGAREADKPTAQVFWILLPLGIAKQPNTSKALASSLALFRLTQSVKASK